MMTTAQLLALAQAAVERAPDAELEKNAVGNLAVVRDSKMIGWLDLLFGEAHWIDDEQWP